MLRRDPVVQWFDARQARLSPRCFSTRCDEADWRAAQMSLNQKRGASHFTPRAVRLLRTPPRFVGRNRGVPHA